MDFIIENNLLKKYCGEDCYVIVPDGVNIIGTEAFADRSTLSSIFLPDSVRWIENDAFSGCTNLTEVSLGTCIDYGHRGAFSGCNNLKELNIRCGEHHYSVPFESCKINNSNLTITRAMVTGRCGPDSVYLYDGHTLWINGTGTVNPLFSLFRLHIGAFDNFEDFNADAPYWFYGLEKLYTNDKKNESDTLRKQENREWQKWGFAYPQREEYDPSGYFPDMRDLWFVEEVQIQEGITELACGTLNPLFAIVEHEEFDCISGEGLYGPQKIFVPNSLQRFGNIPYDAAKMGNQFQPHAYERYGRIDCKIKINDTVHSWGWVEQIAGKRFLKETIGIPEDKPNFTLWDERPHECGKNAKVVYDVSHKKLTISGIGIVSFLDATYIAAKAVVIEDGITQLLNDVEFPETVKVMVVPKNLNLPWPENSQKYKILRRGINKFIKLRCYLGI